MLRLYAQGEIVVVVVGTSHLKGRRQPALRAVITTRLSESVGYHSFLIPLLAD